MFSSFLPSSVTLVILLMPIPFIASSKAVLASEGRNLQQKWNSNLLNR